MRRAIVTGTATVSGVVLLLGLKPHSGTPTAAKGDFTITQSDGQSSDTQSGSQSDTQSAQGGGTNQGSAPGTSTGPKSGGPAQPGNQAATSKTVTGDSEDTRYGPVQLAVTFSGKKITKIQVLQYPTESGRDQEINSYAIPQLNQEAMSAQSANIDAISGASYTSDGYQRSLQSAIDKANA